MSGHAIGGECDECAELPEIKVRNVPVKRYANRRVEPVLVDACRDQLGWIAKRQRDDLLAELAVVMQRQGATPVRPVKLWLELHAEVEALPTSLGIAEVRDGVRVVTVRDDGKPWLTGRMTGVVE